MKLCVKKLTMAIFLAAAMAGVPWSAPHAVGAPVEDPAKLFGAKCASCHGMDGAGNTPVGKKLNVRSFQSPEVKKMTDAQLADIIGRGKNKMPGYEKTLGKQAVADLAAYTRSLSKK